MPRVKQVVTPGVGWLTPKDAASQIKVSVRVIYDACTSKRLRSTKFGHSTLRIRQEWLDAWAESLAS